MRKGFWENKPLDVHNSSSFNQILTNEELLDKINGEIKQSRLQLNYKVYDNADLACKIESIQEFINNNYITSTDSTFKLVYSQELLSFCFQDSLLIEFSPRNNDDTIIGYIVGKRKELKVQDKSLPCLEVNFLCLIPKLRTIGVSSYMINVLTRECVERYNIGIAHYTIGTKINSPHFGEKPFYHRLLNIDNLSNAGFYSSRDDLNLQKKICNTFNYKYNFDSTHSIEYINGDSSNTTLINELYIKYLEYCQENYNIYEEVDFKTFKDSFSNKAFHHFIVRTREDNHLKSYVCIFRLDTVNTQSSVSYKCGYYYYMWFKINKSDCLEYIHEYIYKNDILDIISFSEIFDFNISFIKAIKGSSKLRYYLFNISSQMIENNKNGLITI